MNVHEILANRVMDMKDESHRPHREAEMARYLIHRVIERLSNIGSFGDAKDAVEFVEQILASTKRNHYHEGQHNG